MSASVIVAGLLLPVIQAQAEPRPHEPIIDVHQHASGMWFLPDGSPPPRLCVNQSPSCENAPSRYTTNEGLLRGTLDIMRRYNIVRAVVSSGDSVELGRWLTAAPGRFVGGRMLDGVPPEPDVASLRAAFERGTYGVLGEIAAQYQGLAPDDPALEPYIALAEELDVPVLIHCAGIGAPLEKFRSDLGRPLRLEGVLKRHPKLRLYVENAGYPFADEMIALMVQYPQVYADLSTITWLVPREAFHDYLRRMVRAGFGKRLMFGSDQMIWPETIGMAVESVDAATFLTREQKSDIFHDNAARFFRMSDTAKVIKGDPSRRP